MEAYSDIWSIQLCISTPCPFWLVVCCFLYSTNAINPACLEKISAGSPVHLLSLACNSAVPALLISGKWRILKRDKQYQQNINEGYYWERWSWLQFTENIGESDSNYTTLAWYNSCIECSEDTKTWRRWFCCLRPIPLYSRLSYVFPACCISHICGLKHWEVTKVLWVRRNNVISLHASKAQPLLIIEKTIWTKWIDLFIHSAPYVQKEIQKSQKVTECWIMWSCWIALTLLHVTDFHGTSTGTFWGCTSKRLKRWCFHDFHGDALRGIDIEGWKASTKDTVSNNPWVQPRSADWT